MLRDRKAYSDGEDMVNQLGEDDTRVIFEVVSLRGVSSEGTTS